MSCCMQKSCMRQAVSSSCVTQIYKSIRWECFSYSTISISIMSPPPSSFHATQTPLNLPHVLSTTPFTKLPWPNAIDDWLAMNYLDGIHNFYSPGYMHLRDYLMIKWCVYFSYMLKQYISFLYHPKPSSQSINRSTVTTSSQMSYFLIL